MSLFKLDWNDLETVKAYAKKLATPRFPQFVCKHRDRTNYNIGMRGNRKFDAELATGVYTIIVEYVVKNGIVFGSDEYNLTTFEKLPVGS